MTTSNRIILIDRLAINYAKGTPTPTQEDIHRYRTYLGTLAEWQLTSLYDTWLQQALKLRSKTRNPNPTQQPTLI